MAETPPLASTSTAPARRAGGDGPPAVAARRAAARRADVADGRARRGHAAHHLRRRAAGSAGADPWLPSARRTRPECRPRARLPGSAASAGGAGASAASWPIAQAAPASDPRATANRRRRRRRIRSRPSGGGASTRASSPATSCSAAGRRRSGRTSASPTCRRQRRRVAAAGHADRSTRSRTPSCARPPERAGLVRPRASSRGRPQPLSDDAATAATPASDQSRTPAHTDPISAAGPLHRVLEGHGHRHRADESSRWHHGGAGELPRHQSALLAQRTARR